MTVTIEELRRAHAEHGARLVLLGEEPGEVYSADPGDYWNCETVPGTLALRVPEHYIPVWAGTADITDTSGYRGTPVHGFDSIEDWAVAHGWELEDVLEEGVSQDDDGTIYVPDAFPEGFSESGEDR